MNDTDAFQLAHLLHRGAAILADWERLARLPWHERTTAITFNEIEQWSQEANDFLAQRVPTYSPIVISIGQHVNTYMAAVARIIAALKAIEGFRGGNPTQVETKRSMVTILFLAANPTDATRIALDVEFREIKARLRAVTQRDRFSLHHSPAIQAKDLADEILHVCPTILHFSGHGSPQGELVLVDANNRAAPVGQEAFADLLRIFSDRVRCVVLNACFSHPQAVLIAQHVEAVVGISSAVPDTAAIAFSQGFYNALGHGENLRKAFEVGRNIVLLLGFPKDTLPELICRAGMDPTTIVL